MAEALRSPDLTTISGWLLRKGHASVREACTSFPVENKPAAALVWCLEMRQGTAWPLQKPKAVVCLEVFAGRRVRWGKIDSGVVCHSVRHASLGLRRRGARQQDA